MICAIPLLVVAFQHPTTVRPAGSSQEFHAAANAIESAIAAKDYAKAQRLLRLLPKENVTYRWDDSKVPPSWRADFASARDRVFREWTTFENHLTLKPGTNPDIVFSFEPVLANDPQTGYAKGLVTFFNDQSGKPRLEAVIGLKRGPKKAKVTSLDIENEVRYTIGSYLGLAPAPVFGPAMGRTDLTAPFRTILSQRDASIALNVQGYAMSLRNAIAKKISMPGGQPVAYTDSKSVELGRIVQGTVARASIQFTNNGTGPLAYTIIPDCGCTHASPPGTIQPGQTKLLGLDFDSSEFVGKVTKHLLVYTNDPDNASYVIPLNVMIEPGYRFVRPEGDVLSVDGRQGRLNVYLYLPKGSTLKPTGYRLEGLRGVVNMEEWSGELADPALNEGPLPRTGYKFTIDIDDMVPIGRPGASLVVQTDNEKFPSLIYNFYVQRGIIALPITLYLGEIGSMERTSTFLVTRPGKPFKVLGVESGSPNFTANYAPGKNDAEYVVTVKYDGKASPGPVSATLTVKTDDASQPTVKVPIRATVR